MVTHRRTATESNRCSEAVAAHRVPRLSPRGPMRAHEAGAGGAPGQALLPEAARDEMRRARTCKPSLSKSTRDLTRPPRHGTTRERVSSSLHGVLPASATSTEGESGVFFRLVSVGAASGAPGASSGARLAAVRSCRAPTPVSTEARVNGLALHGLGASSCRRTCACARRPPTVCRSR